jgi:hypothetical protein
MTENEYKSRIISLSDFLTRVCFVAHKMCCTLMILSVEQKLLDRWHFSDDIQKQKCSPRGLYGRFPCNQIMMRKLITCLDTLSDVLPKLQDVSVFVEGFLVS